MGGWWGVVYGRNDLLDLTYRMVWKRVKKVRVEGVVEDGV